MVTPTKRSPILTPGWAAAVALGSLIILVGFVEFERSESAGLALGLTVVGGVVIGAGSRAVGHWPRRGAVDQRRLRRAALLVPVLLIPFLAALTPIAFRARPGDYSIFAVIPFLATLGVPAVLLGDWLGRKVVIGAMDEIWPRRNATVCRHFDLLGLLLVSAVTSLLAGFVCLLISVEPTGHSTLVYYAEFFGAHLSDQIVVLHPALLWISRALVVTAVALGWLAFSRAAVAGRARRGITTKGK